MECTETSSNSACESADFILHSILNIPSDIWKFQNSFAEICLKVKDAMDWNFDFQQFYYILCESKVLTLECAWNLHIFQVMPFKVYLLSSSNTGTSEVMNKIDELFLKSSKLESISKFHKIGIFAFLVECSCHQHNDADQELQEVCTTLLVTILKGLFAMSQSDVNDETLQPLFALWSCGTIESPALKNFCKFALSEFMKNSHQVPEIKTYLLEKSGNELGPMHFLPVIQRVTSIFKEDELRKILFDFGSGTDVNWQYLAVFVHALLHDYINKGATVVSNFVTSLINTGFEEQSSSHMLKAFSIGRQIASSQGVSFSVAYGHWFQAQFLDNPYLKNPDLFIFFIRVLSDLIPHETDIEMIKMYLSRPLIVPQECHILYMEYNSLLKTRIKDLEPRVRPEEILHKVLAAFAETKKVPSFILEASLMQKHQFLNEFLPILLTPRMVPKVLDTKEIFIEELNKLGKIPAPALLKYRMGCQAEQRKYLGGLGAQTGTQ